MSLRHALLALIEIGPTTGYALTKLFDQSVTRVWSAQHSQIYTELRKMEAEGLIEAQEVPRGERALATKRPYAVTADGVAELSRWVDQPFAESAIRDPAYLQATYLEFGSLARAREQFREHRQRNERLRDQLEFHLEHLQRRDTDLLRRRLAVTDEGTHDAIVAFKVHAYRGLVQRAVTEIDWAQRGIDLVDRLSAAPGADPDRRILEPTAHDAAPAI